MAGGGGRIAPGKLLGIGQGWGPAGPESARGLLQEQGHCPGRPGDRPTPPSAPLQVAPSPTFVHSRLSGAIPSLPVSVPVSLSPPSLFPRWAPSSPAGLCVLHPPCLCLTFLCCCPLSLPLPPSSLLPPSLHLPVHSCCRLSLRFLSPSPSSNCKVRSREGHHSLPFLSSLLPPCSVSLILCGSEGACRGCSKG